MFFRNVGYCKRTTRVFIPVESVLLFYGPSPLPFNSLFILLPAISIFCLFLLFYFISFRFNPSPSHLLHPLLQFSFPSGPITSLFPPFLFSYSHFLIFTSLLILYPPPLYTLPFLHVSPLLFLLLSPSNSCSCYLLFLFFILLFSIYPSSPILSLHHFLLPLLSPRFLQLPCPPGPCCRGPTGQVLQKAAELVISQVRSCSRPWREVGFLESEW